jgi:hypothetical protein
MAEKEVRSIRLPKPEAEQVEQYAKTAGMTEADAYRRLVRVGLDNDDPERIGEHESSSLSVARQTLTIPAGLAVVTVAVLATIAAGTPALATPAITGIVALFGAAIGTAVTNSLTA